VRTAIEGLAGDKAAEGYRLWWGFSPEQLQGGADAKLVELLKAPQLSLRVLAFENLRRITGMTQSYLPYVTEDRRRTAVRGWEERLANGGVVYATAVTPLSEEW
jgi:hypothetical protein